MRRLLPAMLLLVPVLAHAERPDWRRYDRSRGLSVPLTHLELEATLSPCEAPRGMRDAFPYVGLPLTRTSVNGGPILTTSNLGGFVVQRPQKGSKRPAAIRTDAEAIEAVRLFVEGPLVRTEAAAQRVIAAAEGLARTHVHLKPKVTTHRPPSYTPTARAMAQDRSIYPTEHWEVRLVALEIDRMLRLVEIRATVHATGVVKLERHPLVDGPMTTWQTGVTQGNAEEAVEKNAAMRKEARAARIAYLKALRPAREAMDYWAMARVLTSLDDLRAALGKPDMDLKMGPGSTSLLYQMDDGTAVRFVADAGTIRRVDRRRRQTGDAPATAAEVFAVRRPARR